VFTHNKSHNYLVKAHCLIGEAYLNFQCYKQALQHLTLASAKNQ